MLWKVPESDGKVWKAPERTGKDWIDRPVGI
jgi:hypothetical protein